MKKIKMYQCGWEDPVDNEYPLSIGYLKTNCNADIELIRNPKELKNCDYIGLSSNAWGIQEAIQILKSIKNIPIIIGGQCTLWEDLEKYPFKHIIKGEGEQALNHIIKNNPSEKIIQLPNIENIDTLNYPERGRCTDVIPIFTSRGCPFSCNFCSSQVFWGNTRFHSAEYFIKEVDFLIKKYPQIKTLYIYDDLFIVNKPRFNKIHEMWMARGWHKRLKIRSFVRAGVFTLETAIKMKEMGYYEVRFGAESGSDRVLKILNKGNTVADNQNTIDIARSIKLPVRASFMHHIPGETEEERQMTLDFIKKNKLSVQGWYKFEPFPGTKFYTDIDLSKKGMTNRDIHYRTKNVVRAWDKGKQDISSDVTVFVIAVEKKKNYQACLLALKNQTVDFKLDIIEDIAPMSDAFNQMMIRCKTPYFIQCDEDIILKPEAVNNMHTSMLKNEPTVSTLLFSLYDVHMNRKIKGVRINRTEILKKYPFEDTLCCENTQKIALLNDGFTTINDRRVMGDHCPYWSNYTIFQRYYNMMDRTKNNKDKYTKVPVKLWKILQKNPTELNLYALLGAFGSLFTEECSNKEKNFFTDQNNPKFKIVQDKISQIKKIQFISPEVRHPYVVELSKYLDIELDRNIERVKKSNKALILWNTYSYTIAKKFQWKYDLLHEFKEAGKLAYVLERGALPGSIYLDMHNFLYFSDSYKKKNWDVKITAYEKKQIKEYIKSFTEDECSLEKQHAEFVTKKTFYEELDLSKDTIKVFVASQVYNDTTILLWSDWVKSMPNFQNIIKELGCSMRNVEFLVKNHPVETTLMTESKNVKIVDKYHYKDCIKYSDIVLTINSGIGLQAMMWGKPVITVGKCFYNFKGINKKANSIRKLKKYIHHPRKPDMHLVEKFLHYLKNKFYMECEMKMTSRGSSTLERVKHIRYQTPYELVNYPVADIIEVEKKTTNIVPKVSDNIQSVFLDFINIVPDCCLLQRTCLEAIKKSKLSSTTTDIFISAPEINSNLLRQKMFIHDEEKNTYAKNGIKVHILKWTKNTKPRSLYGCNLSVPMPVIGYLEQLYGKNWRNHE